MDACKRRLLLNPELFLNILRCCILVGQMQNALLEIKGEVFFVVLLVGC